MLYNIGGDTETVHKAVSKAPTTARVARLDEIYRQLFSSKTNNPGFSFRISGVGGVGAM